MEAGFNSNVIKDEWNYLIKKEIEISMENNPFHLWTRAGDEASH